MRDDLRLFSAAPDDLLEGAGEKPGFAELKEYCGWRPSLSAAHENAEIAKSAEHSYERFVAWGLKNPLVARQTPSSPAKFSNHDLIEIAVVDEVHLPILHLGHVAHSCDV